MKIIQKFDLTHYNSYHIKSECERAVFVDSEEDLIEYYTLNKGKNNVLLGSGHNIILSKNYYDCDFLIFNGNFKQYEVDATNNIIEAQSGITMTELSEIAYTHGMSGLEIFYDIPSSLGGAVVMNAGASGEEIKDVLLKVRYLDLDDMVIKEVDGDFIDFEYRNSFFQKNTNKIVIRVWLQLRAESPSKIKRKMELIKNARWAKQPRDLPNAGSVFKRPEGYYVGALMDELKLKGYTVGGAKISEKHGGFIVNFNNATGQDILEIIKEVQKRVIEYINIRLEVEQRVI